MKYTVKIAETTYEVEIEDIKARPVIAHVNGERFEVQPENENKTGASIVANNITLNEPFRPTASQAGNSRELTAPLPGTVMEVFVKSGEQVEVGKIVLVIEAMKMKNSIRSTRAGKIAEVLVNAGQTVAHKQALVRFE
jgi:biotin carboxyl carrier protein